MVLLVSKCFFIQMSGPSNERLARGLRDPSGSWSDQRAPPPRRGRPWAPGDKHGAGGGVHSPHTSRTPGVGGAPSPAHPLADSRFQMVCDCQTRVTPHGIYYSPWPDDLFTMDFWAKTSCDRFYWYHILYFT